MSTATLTRFGAESIPIDFSADDVWRLPFVGRGATREVYRLSADVVIKVEPIYVGQNRDEITTWQHAQNVGATQYLAPLLAWADDASWVAMSSADPYYMANDVSSEEIGRFRHTVSTVLGIEDLHINNIGSISGRFVMVDYSA